MERTDETGLLYKQGPFNKLDWADEVNRNGYVTYDEALFYRALYCMDKLCQACGMDGKKYRLAAEKVKDSINAILWDEEKGYYVNYKDGDFVEDNLSVDTVLVYLFGIANEERANKMLDAMERLLETKNNHLQQAGDYGVMCVYPFYKRISAAYFKSSQDYEYHNGGNWPYWSAIYAYAKSLAGRECRYALESWFSYNLEKGIFTPVEYFSPCRKSGSTLQAWSGAAAFTFDFMDKENFFAPKYLK
jgi:GH15 family glucan-1,4-alpha-glucosidase